MIRCTVFLAAVVWAAVQTPAQAAESQGTKSCVYKKTKPANLEYGGQTSYDPRFIRDLLPGSNVYKIGALAKLFDIDPHKLDDLPKEKYKLFEECSPITHLTKDDPPAQLIYGMSMEAADIQKRSQWPPGSRQDHGCRDSGMPF